MTKLESLKRLAADARAPAGERLAAALAQVRVLEVEIDRLRQGGARVDHGSPVYTRPYWADVVFPWGKHTGKSFGRVMADDPTYFVSLSKCQAQSTLQAPLMEATAHLKRWKS